VLKCKGRLSNADLEIEAREPMILPREHYLTELIIRDYHNRVHHCGLKSHTT
jgi:2C-methyl-D-erythritol 2,4-cyclodiphosphate synthase